MLLPVSPCSHFNFSFIGNESKKVAIRTIMRNKKRQKVKKTCWVKPWILRRPELDACVSLKGEFEKEDGQNFANLFKLM